MVQAGFLKAEIEAGDVVVNSWLVDNYLKLQVSTIELKNSAI